MRPIITLFMTAGLALAQLESNSITVTASRNSNSSPDQVVFNVLVSTPTTANISDVVAVVSSLGLTSSDLTYLSSNTTYDQALRQNGVQLQWSFSVSAPIAKLKDTAAKLQAFARNAQGVSINVSGTQSSGQACQPGDLISDARAQAQMLANSAGVTLGPILGTSTAPVGVTATGIFISGPASYLIPAFGLYTAPATCSLTVKFGLLRYQ